MSSTDSSDTPPHTGGDPLDVRMLRRLEPRLEALFLRWGVPRRAAERVLEQAVQEIRLRAHRTASPESRLLRAVERRCRDWRVAADAAAAGRPPGADDESLSTGPAHRPPPADDPETGA